MQLPPLNALRAFEAAARHGSFAAAADELNVSAGAISRHVKLLEGHLNAALFERLVQGVRITDAGAKLLPNITEAFETIAKATAVFRAGESSLRLISSPTFANRRLIPRLNAFTIAHPGIDITLRILTSDTIDLAGSGSDCGIITTHVRDWPRGVRALRILHEELVPLCAPGLCNGRAGFAEPKDLAGIPLLSITACPEDWPQWFAVNGHGGLNIPVGGPVLETGEMAIRAAVEGLGVIVMDRLLVERELRDGELVDLFPDCRPVDNGYHFICGTDRWHDPVIVAFRDWIVATFAP